LEIHENLIGRRSDIRRLPYHSAMNRGEARMRRFVGLALGAVLIGALAVVSGQSNTRPYTEGRSSCTPYDPLTLQVVEVHEGADWQLRRGDGAILKGFANREDADAGLAVARNHAQLCLIGKSNGRPNRERYMMEYWK
jgi:hypothetical protein